MAYPISLQERLRGWRRRSLPFGRRPRADSRAQLTGGRAGHNSGRGGVLSPHTPTALGMALQCPGWRRDGGDGRTRSMATEESRFTSPTSRRGLRRARDRHPSPIRGLCRPLSRVRRVGRTRVGGTYDSQACQRDDVHGFVCRCQSIKCPGRGSRYGGGELVGASS
jgi:hypothetical protein